MKRVIFLLVLLIILFSFTVAADSQDIQVTLLSQNPDPVKPGEIVEVKFKIENNGQQTSNDVLVEIMPIFPFSLYGGKETANIGKMRAGQSGSDAAIISYKIKVNEKAVEGDNELELRVKVSDAVWKVYDEDNFLIKIESPDSILAMTGIYTDPPQIAPGQEGKLYIKLENQADNVLRNIRLELNLDEVPVVPIDSSNEKSVYQIESGEDEWVIFNLVVEPDAESKVYKVLVNLTYYDAVGNSYTKESTIGLKIGDVPELLVYISETEVYTAGQKGVVTITIANQGLANVKLMKMTLTETEDYEILSPNEIYLGNVDSDDIESQDFNIYIKQSRGTIDLPVKLEYRDANNKKIEENYKVSLKLYSSSEAKKYGFKSSSTVIWLVFLIALTGIGYFLYRRYLRKKKKKQ